MNEVSHDAQWFSEFPMILRDCLPPTVTALVGSNVTLPCAARGAPGVEWVWTRDMQLLQNSGRVSILEGGARLNISYVQAADGGVYTCNVSNVIDGTLFFDEHSFVLEVLRPPFFTYRPQSITVLSGDMAILFCGGGGNPVPMVRWHRKLPGSLLSEEVLANDRISIADNFILFTEVELSDEGSYFCTLTSPLGTVQSRHTLLNVYSELLHCAPHLLTVLSAVFPSVSVASEEVCVEVGATNTVLQCNFSGDPMPVIQWLKLPEMLVVSSSSIPNFVSPTHLSLDQCSVFLAGLEWQ